MHHICLYFSGSVFLRHVVCVCLYLSFNNSFLSSSQTAQKIFGGEIRVHNLLFIKKDADNFDSVKEQFSSAAEEYKGKVRLCALVWFA